MKTYWLILFLILTMVSSGAVGFSQLNPSSLEDITPFEENGLFGYKNNAGKVIIKPKYVEARPFSDGVGRVALKSKKYFYINSSGKKVVSAEKYHDAGDFHNGLAWVGFKFEDRSSMQYGFINKKGSRVIKMGLGSPGDFLGEVALISKNGLYFINKKGKIVSEALYDRTNYYDGVVRLKKQNGGNRYYYFDVNGKNITPAGFENGYLFSEGLAAVSNDSKWGFINTKGEWVIPPKYESVEYSFNEDLAMVDDKNRRIFINKSGIQVGSDYYPIANTKGIDLAVEVFKSNGKYGLKFQDKEYLKAEYDQIYISTFWNNRIEFIITQNNKQGLCGLYIHEGLIYFKRQKPVFDYIYAPLDQNGVVRIVQDNGKIGLMRITNGDNYSLNNPDYWVSPPKYDFVDHVTDYIFIAKNGKTGIIDYYGTLKVKPEYDEVSVYNKYPAVFTGITNGGTKYINNFNQLIDNPDQYIAQQIEQDYRSKIEEYFTSKKYTDAIITAEKSGQDDILADALIRVYGLVPTGSFNPVAIHLIGSEKEFYDIFDIVFRINDERKEVLSKMRTAYINERRKVKESQWKENERKRQMELAEAEHRKYNSYSGGNIGTYNSSSLKSYSSQQHQREMRNYREQTDKIKREIQEIRQRGNYNKR